MVPTIKRTVTIALLVYLGFGAYLYAFQRNILFYPSVPLEADHLEKLWIDSEGEKLLVWVVNAGNTNGILYFGGNAEAVAHNAAAFADLFPGYTVYFVNYRGYGGSTGSPSEEALYKDAATVYDLIAKRHDSVSAIGRSLGSGIGVHLATVRTINKLALITPYDSIAAVAQSKYPVYPISLLLKDKFDALKKAPRVDADILILIAEQDQLINPKHAHRLVAALPPDRLAVHSIDGVDHFNITGHADYDNILSAFFDQNGSD